MIIFDVEGVIFNLKPQVNFGYDPSININSSLASKVKHTQREVPNPLSVLSFKFHPSGESQGCLVLLSPRRTTPSSYGIGLHVLSNHHRSGLGVTDHTYHHNSTGALRGRTQG